MRIRTKIMLTYSLFVLIVFLSLGIGFYMYNARLFQKSAESNLSELVYKTSQQLDSCVKEMDNMAIEIIADQDIIDALRSLSIGDSVYSPMDFVRFSDNIQKTVAISAIFKSTIYRASIFNSKGYFITSKSYDEISGSVGDRIKNLFWIRDARAEDGSKYLVAPHKDDWSSADPADVFSLVRVINDPGKEIGFVEIQQSIKKIQQICDIKVTSAVKVIVVDPQRNLIYANTPLSAQSDVFYKNIALQNANATLRMKEPESSSDEILSCCHSDYTGWTVLISQSQQDLLYSLKVTRNIIFLVSAVIILLTLLFFYIFARQLSLPLQKLKESMEAMNIENLPDPISEKHENNEIQALNHAFQKMRGRLNVAIEQEIRSRSMQLDAHFNSLQAQINPHFLYNMLGILANMGDEANQPEITATCNNLAKMLRYSASTSDATATLEEEIVHAGNYLDLMQRRFEHRLRYHIHIDPQIQGIRLPKLTIQPLVENSITHGFDRYPGTMEIAVEGLVVGDRWQIRVTDNGSGFQPDILQTYKERIDRYIENLLSSKTDIPLSIGGMGLISTFARLHLLYGDDIEFELKNNAEGGASILLRGKLTDQGNGEDDTENV